MGRETEADPGSLGPLWRLQGSAGEGVGGVAFQQAAHTFLAGQKTWKSQEKSLCLSFSRGRGRRFLFGFAESEADQ